MTEAATQGADKAESRYALRGGEDAKRRLDLIAGVLQPTTATLLFATGRSQAEVARTLGVARQNVSRWHARWQAGGLQALASRGPTGPAPRLSDAQLHDLEQALRQGARAHGFDTDHWTLARITTVIEQTTGARYHPGHVWKLLRRMGWRLPRPTRRAVERDEQAIARWVAKDWP